MPLTVIALSFFSALKPATASASASCAREIAVSLSNPSAVPENPVHAAEAGDPCAMPITAAIKATTANRHSDLMKRLPQTTE